MKKFAASFIAELMKQRKSRIFLITTGLFIFIPLMMGLLMYVSQHPEIGAKLGLVAAKASFFQGNSWLAFSVILNQTIAMIGIIGFGFVTAWVFGREYTEQTIKDIIALPVSRTWIVISKFLVVLIWCSLLSLVMFISSLIMGRLISIPNGSGEVFTKMAHPFFTASFLTLLLSPIVAFIASVSRGIIAPIGFVIFMVLMSQFIVLAGIGAYFPWAIPGVYTVGEGMQLVSASYIILILTGISGLLATIFWWKFADQH
ncbi:MAG: ABC transporter permease [Bacteroidales bacterium]|nr:ABC transporter permease [Bacteroidales bacterium]MCF8404111.1 ABC transporter permease [Bacteroidales bacterium]